MKSAVLILGLLGVASAAQNWVGSNLYYAAGLTEDQQTTLFTGLQSANVKVLRVWLDGQGGNPKGTPINPYPSLEDQIGQYNPEVLERYDALMLNAVKYGIKLLISPYSWNSLDAGDCYTWAYGKDGFYTRGDAQAAYDNRLRYVLNHVHPTIGKPWKELDNHIFGFETQNEAMIGLGQQFIQDNQGWQCARASTIKGELGGSSSILVMTGGESWSSESMQPGFLSCQYLDVISLHGYGAGNFDVQMLQGYVQQAKQNNKKLLFEEWGACYFNTDPGDCPNGDPLDYNTRSQNIKTWADQISQAGLPWMYWQIIPNKDPHEGYDFEIGINDDQWSVFQQVAQGTKNYQCAFDYTNLPGMKIARNATN